MGEYDKGNVIFATARPLFAPECSASVTKTRCQFAAVCCIVSCNHMSGARVSHRDCAAGLELQADGFLDCTCTASRLRPWRMYVERRFCILSATGCQGCYICYISSLSTRLFPPERKTFFSLCHCVKMQPVCFSICERARLIPRNGLVSAGKSSGGKLTHSLSLSLSLRPFLSLALSLPPPPLSLCPFLALSRSPSLLPSLLLCRSHSPSCSLSLSFSPSPNCVFFLSRSLLLSSVLFLPPASLSLSLHLAPRRSSPTPSPSSRLLKPVCAGSHYRIFPPLLFLAVVRFSGIGACFV